MSNRDDRIGMGDSESFLGKGWSFPPTFDKHAKTVRMVGEEEDIAQALKIILLTPFGERVMRPDFGSNLSLINFRAMDGNTINELRTYVEQSVLYLEPRGTLHEVDVDLDEIYDGVLKIKLDYTVRKINIRTNIVFPYYFKEGTNITGM
jgi:phage baseplate assembly protein W